MKETIGRFVASKRRVKEIYDYLVNDLSDGNPPHYHIRTTNVRILMYRKVKHGLLCRKFKEIADIDTDYNHISVYDNSDYEFVKGIGEHFNFTEIKKCWDNADLEEK